MGAHLRRVTGLVSHCGHLATARLTGWEEGAGAAGSGGARARTVGPCSGGRGLPGALVEQKGRGAEGGAAGQRGSGERRERRREKGAEGEVGAVWAGVEGGENGAWGCPGEAEVETWAAPSLYPSLKLLVPFHDNPNSPGNYFIYLCPPSFFFI